MKKQAQQQAIDIAAVQSRMLTIRNQQVLLDRDVAALYGVETKALNQAVKRNAEKFPEGYILKMTDDECSRSQIVTLNGSRGSNLKYLPYAFTERGLPGDYMLELDDNESRVLRSKISTLEHVGKGRHSKYNFKAFTEKGLYMLATILKSKKATDATFAIIETFVKVRGLKRELVELHKEADRSSRADKRKITLRMLVTLLSHKSNNCNNVTN